MLIENIQTKQWCLAYVAQVRMDYEKLLPKQRKAAKAFVSVFMCLAAGYKKSFCHGYLPSYLTVCTVQ